MQPQWSSPRALKIICSPTTMQRIANDPQALKIALNHAGLQVKEENFVMPVADQSDTIVETAYCPEPPAETYPVSDGESTWTWTHSKIRLLLSSVEELEPKVGKTQKLSHKTKMWQEIAKRLRDLEDFNHSAKQVANKYIALERRYRVWKRAKETGKNLTFAYNSQMERIMRNKNKFELDDDPELAPPPPEETPQSPPEEICTRSAKDDKTISIIDQLNKYRVLKARNMRLAREMKAEHLRVDRQMKAEYLERKKLHMERKEAYMQKKAELLEATLIKLRNKS